MTTVGYCYDGTLRGLLTLYARLLPMRVEVEWISVGPPAQQGLFDNENCVSGDVTVAEQFWQKLCARLSPTAQTALRRCLLADHPHQELLIYRYLLLEAEQGRRIDGMLAHPVVAPVWKLSSQVAREAHRYLGFVRFKQLRDGLFYAAIQPEHRILLLIGSHFAERFRDQPWVIHDLRHGEGIMYDCGTQEWLLMPMELHGEPEAGAQEERFQDLWRSYFATLAIPERQNLRLQQGKVPLKTRNLLTEFQQSSNNLG